MNLFVAIIIGSFNLVAPFLTVSWSSSKKDSVNINVAGLEESVLECLSADRQARVRIELRLCRHRSLWFNRCQSSRAELHTIEYDEITESYKVISDRFGDLSEPSVVGVPSRSEALREVFKFAVVPLTFLVRDESKYVNDKNAYLSARTVFRCKGSSTRALAHISRILTMGLLNVVESTSDWYDFALFPSDSMPVLQVLDENS